MVIISVIRKVYRSRAPARPLFISISGKGVKGCCGVVYSAAVLLVPMQGRTNSLDV